MRKLTIWMVRTFLPYHQLIEKPLPLERLKELVKEHEGIHLHKSPPRGARKRKVDEVQA